LPTPDGPDRTRGLRKSEVTVAEDIVNRLGLGLRLMRGSQWREA